MTTYNIVFSKMYCTINGKKYYIIYDILKDFKPVAGDIVYCTGIETVLLGAIIAICYTNNVFFNLDMEVS